MDEHLRCRLLVAACENGDVEAARQVLQAGCNPNIQANGCSLLLGAVMDGQEQLVRLLLQAGGDPNGSFRQSPLHFASAKGHVEIIEQLVLAGADVNRRSVASVGRELAGLAVSPVVAALRCGHIEAAGVLSMYGAKRPSSIADAGMTGIQAQAWLQVGEPPPLNVCPAVSSPPQAFPLLIIRGHSAPWGGALCTMLATSDEKMLHGSCFEEKALM